MCFGTSNSGNRNEANGPLSSGIQICEREQIGWADREVKTLSMHSSGSGAEDGDSPSSERYRGEPSLRVLVNSISRRI